MRPPSAHSLRQRITASSGSRPLTVSGRRRLRRTWAKAPPRADDSAYPKDEFSPEMTPLAHAGRLACFRQAVDLDLARPDAARQDPLGDALQRPSGASDPRPHRPDPPA